MRASIVRISSVSQRSKNMPSLVRAAFTSLPSLPVATVSERARRLAWPAQMMPSHSSCGQQVAEDDDARLAQRHQHLDLAGRPATMTGVEASEVGLGQAGA